MCVACGQKYRRGSFQRSAWPSSASPASSAPVGSPLDRKNKKLPKYVKREKVKKAQEETEVEVLLNNPEDEGVFVVDTAHSSASQVSNDSA